MTKYDEIVQLGEETAEMLFADDEDHQRVVKGEAETARQLAAIAAAFAASHKDDLLLIQECQGEAQILTADVAEKKRKIEDALHVGEEKRKIDEKKVEINEEKIRDYQTEKDETIEITDKIVEEEKRLKEKLKRDSGVGKAKLNVLKSISGMEFDAEKENDSVDGVFVGARKSATFHFDKKMKSGFEITQALWDLIGEELETEQEDS